MDLVVEKEMGLAVETEIGVAVEVEKGWIAPLQPFLAIVSHKPKAQTQVPAERRTMTTRLPSSNASRRKQSTWRRPCNVLLY